MASVFTDGMVKAFKRPLTYAALVAVPIIVALFGLLYVYVFEDPYEQLKSTPVAVVNLDAGAVVDGEERNFGDELIDSILENDAVQWTEEASSLLDNGLENTDYYMAVVVPEDFSERVAAGQTADPEQANITFFTNVRKNFMMSVLSSRISSELSTTVNEEVGKQYTEALADGLFDAQEGFEDAEDGASTLQDGAQTLSDALGTAAEGSSSLTSGAGEVESGAQTLAEAAGTLASGAATLEEGSGQFQSTVSSAISQVESGASQYEAAKSAYAQAMAQVQALMQQLASGSLTPAEQAQVIGQLSTAVSSANTAAQSLAAASQAYGAYSALTTVDSGYSEIASGISQVSSGAASLQSGAETLASGAGSVTEGASTLESGLYQASDGAAELTDGAGELTDGLADGTSTISDSLTTTSEGYADYIAEPVALDDDNYGDVDYFGYGFAPLFMTLCLWLGTLLIFFVFEPFPSYDRIGANRFRAVFARWPLYFLMLAVEILAVFAGAAALGVPSVDVPMTVLFMCVIGFAFLCIMQFLNLFDIIGKAIAVLILVFQIACCSGTFPAFLGVDFATTIEPYLPFTYAIDGYRELMSGGNMDVVWEHIGTLMIYAVGGIVLTLLAYPLGLKIKLRNDRKKVIEVTTSMQSAFTVEDLANYQEVHHRELAASGKGARKALTAGGDAV